ncbi:MAG: glycoside hydrolase family 18 [Bacteroidales bacterium]|nr:glycoside hydrolase family 18 [Bacteroidales bacterium]
MKTKIFFLTLFMASFIVVGCDTDIENTKIQKLKTYDEQYYKNLRAFHESDHEISYAYYAAWSPVEGVSGYKDPASWGERIIGLPDSLDIVNLWMGVPTNDSTSTKLLGTTYAPIAYADMKYCQEKKGMKFVMHADASNFNHKFTVDGVEYDMSVKCDSAVIAAYAKWIANTVKEPGLDGVDIDYEGWYASDLISLVKELSSYFGPKSPNPETLLIVDFFSNSAPSECDPYCNYFVDQAYSNQGGSAHPIGGLTPEKLVYCETFGLFYLYGGEILNYAAWEPEGDHHKGGCGAYYMGRNYYSASGIPYNEFRKAIQIMNPALNK